ncbi:hypothetical protein SHIRM173S_08505 [Streptomyces hirsutus]
MPDRSLRFLHVPPAVGAGRGAWRRAAAGAPLLAARDAPRARVVTATGAVAPRRTIRSPRPRRGLPDQPWRPGTRPGDEGGGGRGGQRRPAPSGARGGGATGQPGRSSGGFGERPHGPEGTGRPRRDRRSSAPRAHPSGIPRIRAQRRARYLPAVRHVGLLLALFGWPVRRRCCWVRSPCTGPSSALRAKPARRPPTPTPGPGAARARRGRPADHSAASEPRAGHRPPWPSSWSPSVSTAQMVVTRITTRARMTPARPPLARGAPTPARVPRAARLSSPGGVGVSRKTVRAWESGRATPRGRKGEAVQRNCWPPPTPDETPSPTGQQGPRRLSEPSESAGSVQTPRSLLALRMPPTPPSSPSRPKSSARSANSPRASCRAERPAAAPCRPGPSPVQIHPVRP